ncbi:hypothetical protein TanjilG_28021 [Lupinus angustifolius]|uniref:Uncharacterized protein n=1 Tax=Lupinus angustifolius TaxID=3871 RepID=A0A4P1RGH6_LUPAN|nr:hypothetical protein TanjilG_28021 [Lupinus angustifolius]
MFSYRGETECSDISAKQKSMFFGLSRDDLLNTHHGTDSWARNNGYLESGSGKGLILSGLEAGQTKSKLKPIPQVFKQEQSLLSCHKMQDALSRAHEPTSGYPTNQSKADLLWEKTFTSSLEMKTSSLNQKLASAQTPPWLNASGALGRSSQSHQNNRILGDIWPQHINSKSHLGFHCEVPVQNGFNPGSSSGCKEQSADISSISYDYLNQNNDDHKRIPVHRSNGSAKYYESLNSNCNNKQSGKVINFNVLLSNGSSNMLVTQSGLGIMDGKQKHKEQLAILPWLRAKTAGKNEVQNAARDLTTVELSFSHVTSLSGKDEIGLGSSGKVMHNVTSGFCFNDIEPRRAKISEASAVPVRERGADPEEKQIETPLLSPIGTQYTVEQPQIELMTHAAEAIVAMSCLCCNQVDDVPDSPSESPVGDPLNWFVDVVSSCADNLERKFHNSRERDGEDNEESYSQGLDYFEAMTLNLPETKEEDYMPKPLVSENFRVEETGISLPTRTRNRPVRRGRQWRDFQRDILPGLTSLSRHEVTEDLQAFDSLMRATGHSWHSW